ncbi:MAG: PIG-L family deacetylase [Actinobacteria bacterium]|nr:PIG-L family deacetylase [Actinomycetota bacterium]
MATLVCFHAHPDDESISTGGLMALAADAGHRVVLVTATRGELGEVVPGVLDDGEQLGLRRCAELWASAEALGVDRVEVLGYVDSGMMGEASNDAPWCFWQADVDAAAHRLAAILDEERPEVFTIYDDHGGYGHPDHIQVHRVGLRAAELAGVDGVFQSTMNRDHLRRLLEMRRDFDIPVPDGVSAMGVPEELPPDMGSPESIITHLVDARPVASRKRASMRCHPSQMSEDHFMLAMDDFAFEAAMGWEWYIGADTGDALGGIITAR